MQCALASSWMLWHSIRRFLFFSFFLLSLSSKIPVNTVRSSQIRRSFGSKIIWFFFSSLSLKNTLFHFLINCNWFAFLRSVWMRSGIIVAESDAESDADQKPRSELQIKTPDHTASARPLNELIEAWECWPLSHLQFKASIPWDGFVWVLVRLN